MNADGFIVGLFGVNLTVPKPDLDLVLEKIIEYKTDNPTNILFIFPHWGIEYENVATELQNQWAHLMIDAGADAIIGSHPHVVQNIEVYNGKPIFYSLGNFIFDQYFSEDVQKGLCLNIFIDKKSIKYQLLPIVSIKSQPQFMVNKEYSEFLQWLSSISGIRLENDIKSGVLLFNK